MPYTLSFSGSQRISLDTMGTLGSSFAGALSFGAWIKTSSILTTPQYLFGTSQSAGGNFAFFGMTRLSSKIGNMFVSLRDNSGRTLSVEVLGETANIGRWIHVVLTKDATNTPAGIKIYFNAVSKTTTTVSTTGYADPINFDRQMAIGSSLGSGAVAYAWVGNISTPYFFLRELSSTEITNWYFNRAVPPAEFAGYSCAEGAGTAVADTLNTHNGTLTAAGQWSADTPYKTRGARIL